MAGGDADAGTRAANRLRAAARVGLRLTCPWRIVLAGEVNAGKSSLMNVLVGHGRSIVSPLEGTTRDIVTARTVLDGWEVEIVDVAGTRGDETAVSTIERAGIERALAERALADLVLRVIPADAAAGGGGPAAGHELLVLTKADLATEATLAAATAAGAIVTSAVTGAGVDTLIAAIVERLVPEERLDPDLLAGAVPFTRRQLDAIETLVGPPRSGAGEQP
jgi:tRNA modification GTPase